MLKVFDEVRKNVSFKSKIVQIDSPVFKLHYIFTFGILLICTILVTSQQYIGEHIRCIADKGVADNVINTFCFFTSTFTVVRHLNGTDAESGAMVPHPGVGPMSEDEPIIRHAYYQWVPFVLFGQALMFYVPHLIWKKLEGGRVKAMVTGFEYAALASRGGAQTKVSSGTVPTEEEVQQKISNVRDAFLARLHVNRNWGFYLIVCELLNIVNLVLQVWAMDAFLGGRFMGIGEMMTGADPEDDSNPMDVIFPKVTKCTFHKYGPSGSLQQHDALCVMALNVINEKIYAFLWFWFLILFVVTVLSLVYRLISLVLYSRSEAFNRYVFKYCCPALLDPFSIRTITRACDFSDWLLLHYLALSMDGFVFRKLFEELAIEIEETKPRRNPALELQPLTRSGDMLKASKESLKASKESLKASKESLVSSRESLKTE